jgi:hypothetical protein
MWSSCARVPCRLHSYLHISRKKSHGRNTTAGKSQKTARPARLPAEFRETTPDGLPSFARQNPEPGAERTWSTRAAQTMLRLRLRSLDGAQAIFRLCSTAWGPSRLRSKRSTAWTPRKRNETQPEAESGGRLRGKDSGSSANLRPGASKEEPRLQAATEHAGKSGTR